MTEKEINGWTIVSKDIACFILADESRVSIKVDSPDNEELFYGLITENLVKIYELNTYSSDISIDYQNRKICFEKIEHEY